MKIIGITGTIGAGKGTVVDYLVRVGGFKHYSVREYLIKKIKQQNLPVNRDSMVYIANKLRQTYSPSFIVEELFKQAVKKGGNCIIESIRTQGEVEALQKKGDFILLAVVADAKKRYDRILKRASETDNITLEEFVENEKREMQSDDPNKQNLLKCIEMSNFILNNDGTIADLYQSTEKLLLKNKINGRR